MKKIESIEEAIKLLVENAEIQAQTLSTGNYKLGNKCFDNKMKCLSFIYKQGKIGMLEQYLSHENAGVRETVAYAYLSECPSKAEAVLSEMAEGDYGIHSLNAEMTLKEWKAGRLKLLYVGDNEL